MKIVIVTGTSRGLGKAFFDLLSKKHCLVCISRSFSCDQKRLSENNDIELIKFDLTHEKGLVSRLEKSLLLKKYKFDDLVFINNAGDISPIGMIGSFDECDVLKSINVNYVNPLCITNYLSSFCSINNINFRVINISSGAAERPIEGWSMYCSTKSATKMFLNVFAKEKNVLVYHVDPGVLNTGMQKKIRNSCEKKFPLVSEFKKLEIDKRLKEPKDVAFEILKGRGLI